MRAHDEEDLWPFGDIIGFEDDEDEEEEESEEEESEEDDDDEDEDSEDEEDDDEEEDEKSKSKKKSTAGLKSALRKERQSRRDLQRQLKNLQRELEGLKTTSKPKKKGEGKEEESEDDEKSAEALQKAAQAEERVEKLAAKLATNAVDTIILKHTGDFKDPDDVLRFINRKEIDFDQDDDDPSSVEVDEDSVKDAVKALKKAKPYLLKSRDERLTKSGSKMNGRKKKDSGPTDEQLRSKYSALRR